MPCREALAFLLDVRLLVRGWRGLEAPVGADLAVRRGWRRVLSATDTEPAVPAAVVEAPVSPPPEARADACPCGLLWPDAALAPAPQPSAPPVVPGVAHRDGCWCSPPPTRLR